MNSPLQENEKATLAELEARARELERELAGVQSALAILRARMNNGHTPAQGKDVPLAAAWDTPIPISTPPLSQDTSENEPAENIYLQSLEPHHVLRSKWNLGSGLEEAQDLPGETSLNPENTIIATELRLFGLLSNGMPWEQRVAFADIAGENGIVIGRDAGIANIALDDSSVSRAHVQLGLNEYGLTVSDMGSTNGTAVNNRQLSPYDNCYPLQNGDMLTLGCITLQVEFI